MIRAIPAASIEPAISEKTTNQVLRDFIEASEMLPGERLFLLFAEKYIKRLTKNPTNATVGMIQNKAETKYAINTPSVFS